MNRLIFISGPYTNGDQAANVRAAMCAGDMVIERGDVPFVPHLFHFWELVSPRPYEAWMALDLFMLARCDALLRLPGESPGADREVAHAFKLGIPVFTLAAYQAGA